MISDWIRILWYNIIIEYGLKQWILIEPFSIELLKHVNVVWNELQPKL